MSLQVLMMYLHRYLRLTPALAILMCFFMTLPPYLTSGPFAATNESLTGTCDKWWWYNILYMNNVAKNRCVGWVWYLANDMQFFILSPIFLYAFKVSKFSVGGGASMTLKKFNPLKTDIGRNSTNAFCD